MNIQHAGKKYDNRQNTRRAASVLLLSASHVVAGISLVSWAFFLSHGALGIIDFGFGFAGALILDAFLSLVFFAQHSIMVRRSFKRWMARRVDPDYHGALYATASGIALLALTLLWQAPAPTCLVLRGIPSRLVRVASVLALAGFIWGVRALGSFDMFGTGPIRRSLRNEPPVEPMPLTIRGPYRWVRHPLYFFCLVAIWAVPELTADRLLYNIIWSGWIVVGTMLEERDLVAHFGTAYREYRRKVPMLVPRHISPMEPVSAPWRGNLRAVSMKQRS
jgi:methanethiol S-methyltransferase